MNIDVYYKTCLNNLYVCHKPHFDNAWYKGVSYM